MAFREILIYPDPRLREAGLPVEQVGDGTRALIDDMAETMYAAPGVGLAAPQIGVSQRVFIVDIAGEDEPSNLLVFVNPELTQREGVQAYREGCLSFPGVYEEIKRAERVRIRALDRDGRPFEMEATGLLAVALQHENDHLDGELMIDRVSPLRRRLMGRRLARLRAEGA